MNVAANLLFCCRCRHRRRRRVNEVRIAIAKVEMFTLDALSSVHTRNVLLKCASQRENSMRARPIEHIAAMSMTNICAKAFALAFALRWHPKFSIELSINSCAIKCHVLCADSFTVNFYLFSSLFAYLALAALCFVLSNNDVDRENDDARVIYRNYSHIPIDQLPTHLLLGLCFVDS